MKLLYEIDNLIQEIGILNKTRRRIKMASAIGLGVGSGYLAYKNKDKIDEKYNNIKHSIVNPVAVGLATHNNDDPKKAVILAGALLGGAGTAYLRKRRNANASYY